MAIAVKVIGPLIISIHGDSYAVSIDCQLVDGTTVLDSRAFSANGDLHEAVDLKASIKDKLRANILGWKQEIVKKQQLVSVLGLLKDEL